MNASRTHSQAAQVAAAIRTYLGAQTIKGRVTSETFSNGNAVHVTLTSDPSPAQVRIVEKFCGRYRAGHFDPMCDSYEYVAGDPALPRAKYITIDRRYSHAMRARAAAYARSLGYDPDGVNDRDIVWQVLTEIIGQFWTHAA
ncbi:MAG: hypothetical protein ACRET1_09210 [Burkholderiales bacterium]